MLPLPISRQISKQHHCIRTIALCHLLDCRIVISGWLLMINNLRFLFTKISSIWFFWYIEYPTRFCPNGITTREITIDVVRRFIMYTIVNLMIRLWRTYSPDTRGECADDFGTCARTDAPSTMPTCAARRCADVFLNSRWHHMYLRCTALHTGFVCQTVIFYIVKLIAKIFR